MLKHFYLSTLAVMCFAFLFTLSVNAGTVNAVGSYANWASVDWKPITSQNDPVNPGIAYSYLDIVGSGNDAAAYWSDNGSYIFLRMRLKDPALVTSNAGSIGPTYEFVIDVQGSYYNTTTNHLVSGTDDKLPDYSISWDRKSNNNTSHGLEMQKRSLTGSTWADIQFDDVDNSNGQKLVNDINGTGRTTDGYVRIVDGVATADSNFATTSFVEVAVSWSYLETYTDLRKTQEWNLGVATINNANDHNRISGDIGGGADLTSNPTVSGMTVVPEPATISLLLSGCIGILIKRRK